MTASTAPIKAGGAPIKLLHDRVLVRADGPDGERTSTGGILIPATAHVARRLVWAEVVGVGPNVRTINVGDSVLFEPEERANVEIQGAEFLLLRERDVHAVAGERHRDSDTGLYL
jgi:chaperonin GroES